MIIIIIIVIKRHYQLGSHMIFLSTKILWLLCVSCGSERDWFVLDLKLDKHHNKRIKDSPLFFLFFWFHDPLGMNSIIKPKTFDLCIIILLLLLLLLSKAKLVLILVVAGGVGYWPKNVCLIQPAKMTTTLVGSHRQCQDSPKFPYRSSVFEFFSSSQLQPLDLSFLPQKYVPNSCWNTQFILFTKNTADSVTCELYILLFGRSLQNIQNRYRPKDMPEYGQKCFF